MASFKKPKKIQKVIDKIKNKDKSFKKSLILLLESIQVLSLIIVEKL